MEEIPFFIYFGADEGAGFVVPFSVLSSSDGYLLCHICTGQAFRGVILQTILWGRGMGSYTHARNGAKSELVLSDLLHISQYHQSSTTSLSSCSDLVPSLSQ